MARLLQHCDHVEQLRPYETPSTVGRRGGGVPGVEPLIERCAWLDVHKAMVTACARVPGRHGTRVRTFQTTSAERLAPRGRLDALDS
jgi:hypothetical protein